MLSRLSMDSTRSLADTESARLQFAIVQKHLVVEAHESLVFADRAALQLFHDCAENLFKSFFRHGGSAAALRAIVNHEREIGAGFHGLYGLDYRGRARRVRTAAAHTQLESRWISHSLEPFVLALFS